MALRIPPHNIEAENAVIGALLIDTDSLNKVADILRAEFFYDPRNQVLFEAIISLFKENKPIDVLTLTSELKRTNKIKQAGGTDYLPEIISQVPTSANVVEYAAIVKEGAIRRKLISYSAKFDEIARKEDQRIDEILNELEKDVFSLSQDSSKSD